MKKADNRGLSLVELLIAVCIMTIIVAPMLSSIVGSFRVNAQSRKTLRATTLAQNEMELFEKETIKDLTDPAKYAYVASTREDGYQVTANADGSYDMVRKGVVNNSGNKYDIYIELDPQRADVAARYYNQNNTALLEMNTISNKDSGTYVQDIRTASSATDQDSLAYHHFFDNKVASAATKWTLDYIEEVIIRTITVDIEKYVSGGQTYTRAVVSYNYSLPLDIYGNPQGGVVSPGMETYVVDSVVFDNSQKLDSSGAPIELKSIYLFYAPRYLAATSGNPDKIIVNNKDGLPIDIYLVRQDILDVMDPTNTSVLATPSAYKTEIIISDILDASDRTAGTYHTNLNFGTGAATGKGWPIEISLLDAVTGNPTGKTGSSAIAASGMVSLDATEKKDRIFGMTVKVFEAGDNPATATPLASMTGSKLE